MNQLADATSNLPKPPSIANVFNVIAANSPIIMVIAIFVISLCTSSPEKGVFFVGWIIFATLARSLLQPKMPSTKNNSCDMQTGLNGDDGTFGLYILTFSMMYICLPMFILNAINWYILMFFIVYIMFDVSLKFSKMCFTGFTNTIIIGNFLGAALAGSGASMVMYYAAKDYSYITESNSDTETCKVANKKTFKCKVFKNGELISTIAAK